MIKYGLYPFTEDTRDVAMKHYEYIQSDVGDLKKNYIRLAFHLYEFQQYQYYRDFHYDNFYDFVFENFGLKQSSVSRIFAVWNRFAEKNGDTSTMYLNDAYKEYNYSQLVEMVTLADSEVRKISPDMTVKQIREFKKKNKVAKEKKDNVKIRFDSDSFIKNLLPIIQKEYDFDGFEFEQSGHKTLYFANPNSGETYRLTLAVGNAGK